MENTFELDGKKYTVKPCTAIANCDDYQESERQPAILVSNTTDYGEVVDFVVFGWNMPETLEDFTDMCEDASAWDSDCETLETVKFPDEEATAYLTEKHNQ